MGESLAREGVGKGGKEGSGGWERGRGAHIRLTSPDMLVRICSYTCKIIANVLEVPGILLLCALKEGQHLQAAIGRHRHKAFRLWQHYKRVLGGSVLMSSVAYHQ
jgi:hypothetical protein